MIKAVFTDIGGVLLTNGWDHVGREKAAAHFDLDPAEFAERHEMVFGGYEEGKMTIHDYLRFAVFHTPRPFSEAEFVSFMKDQSQRLPNMIEHMERIKKHHKIPIFAVSNEGRELAEYRIQQFNLHEFIDTFVVSGFVGIRKPGLGIYQLAMDLAQLPGDQVLYIDDRQVLIEAGGRAGLMTLWHQSYETSLKEFERHGLAC